MMRVDLVDGKGGTIGTAHYPGMPRLGDLIDRGYLGMWVVLEVIWSLNMNPKLVISLKPIAGAPLDLRPGDNPFHP